jgi:hypothetical protein
MNLLRGTFSMETTLVMKSLQVALTNGGMVEMMMTTMTMLLTSP